MKPAFAPLLVGLAAAGCATAPRASPAPAKATVVVDIDAPLPVAAPSSEPDAAPSRSFSEPAAPHTAEDMQADPEFDPFRSDRVDGNLEGDHITRSVLTPPARDDDAEAEGEP